MRRSLGARTLAFTTPVWVVATYDEQDRPNAMTASWAGICCSRPPCLNVSLRKATYTYSCLNQRRAFTVNVPSERHAKQIDYLGLVSGRDKDKFAITGLTPLRSEVVDAPYVEEFPLVLECRLMRSTELGLHTMFVGEIVDVKADESVLDENGLPDVERIKPLVFSPEIRLYHGLGKRVGRAFSIGHEFD